MVTLVDSYSEANANTGLILIKYHPTDTTNYSASGQVFTCSETINIVSAKFYMKKIGSPTGNGHAVLYAMTGTYGTNGKPTGDPLATSDDFDVTDLTTSYALHTFTFTGAQQYEMQADTYYCIVFENPATGFIDGSNCPYVGYDSSSPTHDGNIAYFFNSAWSGYSGWDSSFYVYGETAGVEHTHSAADTMAISDSISVAATYNVALADTLSISDSAAALKVLHHTAADTFEISDSMEYVLIEGVPVVRRRVGLPYGLKPARVVKVGRIGV